MPVLAPLTHLGDMPIETFIADYWQKQPLLIRQAIKDFSPIIGADELAGLACEDEVESRLIIEQPETGAWELKKGPFVESEFAELPFSHWTLLVQAIDHWLPAAADFLEQFRFIPSWRLDDLMISYAAKGGGVGPHYDNYDVFLLQAEGQRRWEIGGRYDQDSDILPDKPVRILSDWRPEESWVLEPGDMLYLPPQVGHNGVAESDDCVTYSVGYRAPQHGDMLVQFADFCAQRLKDEDRYADPGINLRLSNSEICRSDIERVSSLLHRFSEDKALLAEWFGRLMTEPKYPEHSPVFEVGFAETANDGTDKEILETLQHWVQQGDTELRRSEGARMAFWQGPESLSLFAEGESLECQPRQHDLVRALCDHNSILPASIEPLLKTDDDWALLVNLVKSELFYWDEELPE